METSIYGLKCEFNYQNEQSIMFYENNGKELTTDDFNSVQLKMIQSNRIPHLLPLNVENIDLSAKLYYNIQSKSKIISFFRNNRATMNDYYQLFLSIVKALEDSGSYMLNQEHYILHTDYIFVGRNASDVYLAYLPVENLERETTALEDMKQLLTDIAGEVEGLQGNEFKSILNYIRSHSFSLPGLKKLLVDLMSVRSNVHQPQNNAPMGMPNQDIPGESDATVSQGRGIGDGSNRNHSQNPPNKQQKVVAGSESKQVKEKKVLPKLSSREAVYLLAAVLLGIAITWKIYEMIPNNIMLIVCTVISIGMAVAGFVYWKVWRPGVQPEIKTVVTSKNKKQKKAVTPTEPPQNQQNQTQNAPSNGQMNQQSMNQQVPQQQGLGAEANMNQPSQPQMNQEPEPNPAFQQETNHSQGLGMPRQQCVNPANESSKQHMDQNPDPGHSFQQPQPEDPAHHAAHPSFESGHAYAAATEPSFNTANADDTVLLDDEDDMPESSDAHIQMPFLIRTTEDGQPNTIQIDQTNFLIGRNDDSVNYVDKTRGISRLHAEIIRIDPSNYGIKDLGSKNGSKLNGEAMVPYKVYALNEEDVFVLGKATYTYTWSADQ